MTVTSLPDRPTYAPVDAERRVRALDSVSAPRSGTLAQWNAAKRIGFRFIFAYFVLYLFPFPLNAIPGAWNPVRHWYQGKQWLALWTETHLFGLPAPVPVLPSGSGDTMSQWAAQADMLLLALGITVVWTLLDRTRRSYGRLNQWLQVYVRFGLASIMFGYGFAKIIPTQMPFPFLDRLVEPFGEFSPMGLLWAFMGFSSVYEIFTGIGEALGSFLILFRRTTTLGALLLCGVLVNVVLLNYTFDVPVKLYSTNLLLMAVFLAAPDARRLFTVLVLNRAVPPKPAPPLFTTFRATVAGTCVATVLVGYTIYNNVSFGLTNYRQSIGPNAPQPPVFGIWDVESLTKNGIDQPPLLSDSTRLKRVVFSELSRGQFRFMSDSVERFLVKVDSVKHEIALTGRFDPKQALRLTYAKPDTNHLVLAGRLGADSVVVKLRRVDEKRFLLTSRGYHWIQEQPFNR
jgi:hypothetical protein